MSNPSTLEICRSHLFSSKEDILAAFNGNESVFERIMRVRDMYMWRLSNPEAKDRQFVDEFKSRYPMGKNAAAEYMHIVNTMLPMLSEKARDFHRWRYNEMILDTYQMAKSRKDTKTMERAASSYARYNRIDAEDEKSVPYHLLVVQPFTATDDPSVLGIKPIPRLDEKIKAMIDKYSAESMDIEDVEFEEADLEEDSLFAPYGDEDNGEEESLL